MNSTVDAEHRRINARQLKALERAFRFGNVRSVAQAVRYSAKYGLPTPEWAIEGVFAITEEFANVSAPNSEKGPLSKAIGRERMDGIHYTRWDAVKELRDRKEELYDIAKTWDDAYAAVSELLEGTEAAGSEDTMKASYQKIERAMRKRKAVIRDWRPPKVG